MSRPSRPELTSTPIWHLHSADPGDPWQKGPLTFAHVLRMLLTEEITESDFAWRPGMAAWSRISDLPELAEKSSTEISLMLEQEQTESKTLVVPAESELTKTPPPPLSRNRLHRSGPEYVPENFPENLKDDFEATHFTNIKIAEGTKGPARTAPPAKTSRPRQGSSSRPGRPAPSRAHPLPAAATSVIQAKHSGQAKPSSLRPILRFALALAFVVAAILTVTRLDFFSGTKSHPDAPSGLSTEEARALHDAATSDLGLAGPKIALVASTPPLSMPVIYVASNLDGPVHIDLRAVGIPKTIAEPPKEVPPFGVTLDHHYAKTEPPEMPRGYYQITALLGPGQSSSTLKYADRLLNGASIRAFLGGSPDLTYQTKLKDYQAVRNGKVRVELETLRDLAAKLDLLLVAQANLTPGLLSVNKAEARLAAWRLFEGNWNKDFDVTSPAMETPFEHISKARFRAGELRSALLHLNRANEALAKTPPPGPGSPRLSPESIAQARAQEEVSEALLAAKSAQAVLISQISSVEKRLAEQSYFEDE